MDFTKEIRRQVQGESQVSLREEVPSKPVIPDASSGTPCFSALVSGTDYNFTFNVKFYPPDPAQLSEDITRCLSDEC